MMALQQSIMRFQSTKLLKILTPKVTFLVFKNNVDLRTTSIWFIQMLVERGCKQPFLIRASHLQLEVGSIEMLVQSRSVSHVGKLL